MAKSRNRKFWDPKGDALGESSLYQKVLRKLQQCSHQELVIELNKLIGSIEQENKMLDSAKTTCSSKENRLGQKLTDKELIELIAHIKIQSSLDSNLEYKKAEAQNKNRYRGKQKGRAYKSFPEH